MQLTQCIKRAAQVDREGSATIFAERRHTWSDFTARVSRLAGGLRELGVSEGDRVAMLALNSDRYLEYYFAIPWAGAVVVPMNIRWSPAENAYSLNDSGARVMIVDDAFAAMVPKILAQATLDTLIYAGEGETPDGMLNYEALIADNAPASDAERGGEDLAGIFYTGGTTGFPKGVMLPHRGLWSSAIAMAHHLELDAGARYLHAAPMFHLADGAMSMACCVVGAGHVMISAFSPQAVLEAASAHRPTHLLLVPTMVKMVLDDPGLATADLSSVQRVLYGASPMPEGVLLEAFEKLPHCGWLQAYGQTELSPVATVMPPEYHVLEGPKAGKLRSAGRAAVCCEVRIVDETGDELPRGEVGQISVRGPNTMQGYWNKPEETADTLIDGWVRTGDGAYMDEDGFIFIMDRFKDMIISGGENIFSAEVESALSKHPAVGECAVVGIPDEEWGETVHAIVVLAEGAEAAEAMESELIGHCRELIAHYKCPRSLEFRSEPLPLSGAGKVLKKDLRAPFWEGREREVN